MPAKETWDKTFGFMWDTQIIPSRLTRVCIFGYSRTGKSTTVHERTKSHRITFHQAMPLDDLIGGMGPNPNAAKDGAPFVWLDGPATKAMREGTVLQIDEFNEIPPECTTMAYAILDKPAGITLPTGERVNAKKGFCVICTMNPTPDVLPHPIFDRIDCFLKADTLSAGIREHLGPHLAVKAEQVIGRGQQPLDTWSRNLTVNSLLAFKELQEHGIDTERAAHMLGFMGQQAKDFIVAVTSRKV